MNGSEDNTMPHPNTSSTEHRSQISDNAYALMVTTIFLLLGGFIAWHHEMWRDEIQAWLIARDSASPTEVLYHLNRYDGHPGLWHLCLYVLKHITWSPMIMQPFHLIIAAATVYLFLRFSPFTRLQKALFPFGYLAFYEYAIMCRNYALGILFLFLFCTLFKGWKTRFPLVGFVLLLLAHTSVIGLIVVISIGISLFWELTWTSNRPGKADVRLGSALILFGILTSIIQLKPTGPGRFEWHDLTRGIFDLNRLQDAVTIMPKVFFPIPEFTLRFWNTYLLDKLPAADEVNFVLAILILLFALILLLRKPAAFVMYLSGTIGLLLFFSAYPGFIRHWGYLFMLFLAAIWVSHYCDDIVVLRWNWNKRFWGKLNQASLVLGRSLNLVLIVILIIHLAGAIAAASLDYKYPFSEGKAVARFIKQAKLDDMIIAPAARGDVTLEILGYLEKDRFYYPRPKRFGSFVVGDTVRTSTAYLPTEDVLQELQRFSNEKGEDILVISSRIYSEEIQSRYALTKVKVFRPSVVRESLENYVLYLMTPPAQ